jgi:hypothetical protein
LLVSEVIDRTYSTWLNPAGINRPAFDVVKTAGVLSGSTEGTFEVEGRVANIPDDSIVEIGSELIRTKVVTGAAPTVTVTTIGRGYLETVAATHVVGDVVTIDPKFPRINILNALKDIVGELLPNGLYVRATTSSLNWDYRAVVALPTGALDVLSLIVRRLGTYETYTDPLMEGLDYVVLKEFTPPKLRMLKGGFQGSAMTIVYTKDFTLPTAETDDLDTLGVPATLQPNLPMALAGYLLQGREIPRVQVEEVKRQLASQGIQVGAALNIGQSILNQFWARYAAGEKRRLAITDPPRMSWARA